MNKELQDKLYAKYPKIFRQKDLDKMQTLMCWGCEIDSGWYDLIDETCSQLQWNTDHNDYPQVEFVQVKEKYGSLRIYTAISPKGKKSVKCMDRLIGLFVWISNKLWQKGWISCDFRIGYINDERNNGSIDGAVDFAESFSTRVCEICGEKASLQTKGGWLKTLCEKHKVEQGYQTMPEESKSEELSI